MAAHALRGGSDRSRDEHFVGRDRELSVLHAQLGHACEGRSGLVVLEGPAGIGKTALERRVPDPLVAGAALLELLGRLQHRALVVLAVDGADWADLLSLQALKYRARAAA